MEWDGGNRGNRGIELHHFSTGGRRRKVLISINLKLVVAHAENAKIVSGKKIVSSAAIPNSVLNNTRTTSLSNGYHSNPSAFLMKTLKSILSLFIGETNWNTKPNENSSK